MERHLKVNGKFHMHISPYLAKKMTNPLVKILPTTGHPICQSLDKSIYRDRTYRCNMVYCCKLLLNNPIDQLQFCSYWWWGSFFWPHLWTPKGLDCCIVVSEAAWWWLCSSDMLYWAFHISNNFLGFFDIWNIGLKNGMLFGPRGSLWVVWYQMLRLCRLRQEQELPRVSKDGLGGSSSRPWDVGFPDVCEHVRCTACTLLFLGSFYVLLTSLF